MFTLNLRNPTPFRFVLFYSFLSFLHLLLPPSLLITLTVFDCSLRSHQSHLQLCCSITSALSAYTRILLAFPSLPVFSLPSGPSFLYIWLHPPKTPPTSFFLSPFPQCVCVVAECVWLFFRQQPRRLDCHNLWFWVISVSNPNLGTGTFFLPSSSYSSSSPTPSPSRSFSPSCAAFHIIFHSLPVTQQHNPFWTVSIIQSLAPDHHLWGRSILLSFKFTLAFIWMNGALASWPFMAFSAAGSSVALMSFSNQIVFFICMYACICTVLCFSTSQGTG